MLLRRKKQEGMARMKKGDMVRFAKWEEVMDSSFKSSNRWHAAPKNHIGILVDHDKLMGAVHVLCEGEIYKVRPVFVQKAGKKDFEGRS